jgi:hypothetical protein
MAWNVRFADRLEGGNLRVCLHCPIKLSNMASDYNAIRAENQHEYGAGIGRIGHMLLANRYADRTHFIFELLQNAEDALSRRQRWHGSTAVTFVLESDSLRISHFGKPFDEGDVRGICGIGESTKDFTAIGRFGIGFKSVYAFTERPEIHSGLEDFAIENFVWPVAVPRLHREAEETVIVVPLKHTDQTAHKEIASGLERLGTSTLLFLRNIEEINWNVIGGGSGVYLREEKHLDTSVRQVDVVGQERGKTDSGSRWLVFSRLVNHGGRGAGYAEIAFSIVQDARSRHDRIQPQDRSPLVVFFPTVLETYLGFQVQGPYRTTPSRDNIPCGDEWNQHLVEETALLLVDSLGWLRDHGLLDVAALRCLPLEVTKFGDDSMFQPLFEATKIALMSKPLLPRFDGGHIAATSAKLARTQELRDLFSPAQLARLFGQQDGLVWLTGDITQDRAPEIRQYLISELEVDELTPDAIIPRLSGDFLKSQSDAWIVKLYEFLNGQPALHWRLSEIPLIRLEDGRQVLAEINGRLQAFLPSAVKTSFPAVRASVCATEKARSFLRSLRLTEPDPVDDVTLNLLPKYRKSIISINEKEYAADIERILAAFETDSKVRREALIIALKETAFVMVVDAGDGSKSRSRPDAAYLSTERLKQLFSGVNKVFIVNDSYECLRGEETRELLEACGTTRYLQPISVNTTLSSEERNDIRRNAGLERSTWQALTDVTLRGLDSLLKLLPLLAPEARQQRSNLLWEALIDLENRRGSRAFLGEYKWGYAQISKRANFDAAFLRQLNETEWVANHSGVLERPEFVLFDVLGWQANPFLQSKIRFKPPLIETLAREAGIEPGVLDLLKKIGLTNEAELRNRLGLADKADNKGSEIPPNATNIAQEQPQVMAQDLTNSGDTESLLGSTTTSAEINTGLSSGEGENGQTGKRASGSTSTRHAVGSAGGEFVSYIAVKTLKEESDSDGLDHAARMVLESKAIDLILHKESCWKRTATHNPGYDLYVSDGRGGAVRWCEVKAMTGSLEDRPVGLSRTQFEFAQKHGEEYWLYVVEHAATDKPRIVRIQDPAGKAETFTFDKGWIVVADTD